MTPNTLMKSDGSYRQLAASAPPYHGSNTYESSSEAVASKSLIALSGEESFFDGIKKLDPKLLTDLPNNLGLTRKYTVLEGQVGLSSHYGNPIFFPPGNYAMRFRPGWGGMVVQSLQVSSSVPGAGSAAYGAAISTASGQVVNSFEHMGIRYLELKKDEMAVVQDDREQIILGCGRYVLRTPTKLMGVVNVKQLTSTDRVRVITENAVDTAPVPSAAAGKAGPGATRTIAEVNRKVVELTAGTRQSINAVTFMRPEPGFVAVVESADGRLSTARGFQIIPGSDKFIGFVDVQQYARTTRAFAFQSTDRQEGQFTLNLTWRIADAPEWVANHGSYEDLFDALEEIVQSLMRDVLGAMPYKQALSMKETGYQEIEEKVMPALDKAAADLGGKVLSMQVRDLVFPLLATAEREQAEALAAINKSKMEAQNRLELQNISDTGSLAKEHAEQERRVQATEAEARVAKINKEKDLANAKADNELAMLQQSAQQTRKEAELTAVSRQRQIEAAIAEGQAESAARIQAVKAKSEADAIFARARAEAEAQRLMNEAQAAGIAALGETLKNNPNAAELEKLRIESEYQLKMMEQYRQAIVSNPNIVAPFDVVMEGLRMKNGFAPQVAPVVAGGVVAGSATAADLRSKHL